MATVGVKGLK